MSEHTPEPWGTPSINRGRNQADCWLMGLSRSDESDLHWGRDGHLIAQFLRPEDRNRAFLAVNAMSGIAHAAPGSVAKLVEAAKLAIDGLCDPDRSGPDVARLLVEVNTALAAIKIEGGG